MTIKHQNKNISAEKQYVITDVQDNPNGILIFTLSNLYSNTTDTLQIDLSKHKLKLTKVTQSELNRLKNSQDEIDIKNRESHIYLVQKNTSDEGVYQEFIWVDDDFEIIGSTAINLEPYFLKENVYNGLDYDQNNNTKALSAYQGYLLNQNKINKSDIATNLTTDNDNKVLSAKQGKLLQDNKLNKNQIPHKGKNVVVDNNSGEITFEDKPTIPEASTTTPLSDSTNGNIGDSNKWAKADHIHPKSNLYAESGHNHDNTYIKLSNTAGLVKNDGTIDTSTYLIKSNFKTIDGSSIVGSGNISLPSKLSDLTNDTGFITLSALNDYVTKDNLSIKYSNEIPTEVDPSEPYSLCIVKSSNGYDVYSIQESSTGDSGEWVKSATIPSDFAISSHNHNDLYYTKSEVDNMNLGGGGEVDLSNYIRKSSTSGLVKNDGSIDSNDYVTSQELHKNIPMNYVVTSTDNTFTEDVSTFIVGKDYYFVVRTFQGLNEVNISGIRCEVYHSGTIKDLTPVEFDNLSNVFKFTPMEQKGYILKVYDSDILVATYTFDAIIDTGWQNVSFLDGYTNYSGDNLKIRRIGNIVEINGSWTTLEDKPSSQSPINFATIDEMFRPVSTVWVRQQGPGMNTYLLLVAPNGNVGWSKYSTNSITASGKCTCHALWTVNGGAVGGGSNGTIDTSAYVRSDDIVDNLTTNDSTKVLSAKQGYQLNQLIGSAISYINQ